MAALMVLAAVGAWAADDPAAPRGALLELHSCELFAGSCVVSSEAEVAGNYVLRVWRFEDGKIGGVALRGLTVALLERGELNLAVPENRADGAVVYLPKGLRPEQRATLLAWAAQNTAAKPSVKELPLAAQFGANKVSFSAGADVAFTGGTPATCEVGGCGEMLWYEPRGASSSFVVDQLDRSRIVEPLLAMKWMDHGRRTLFVGRFGDPEPTGPAICGAARTASL